METNEDREDKDHSRLIEKAAPEASFQGDLIKDVNYEHNRHHLIL